MDRKGFGAILDETVGRMENDVRVLKNQQATLKTNLSELESKRDRLSEEIFGLEKKHSTVVKECKAEIDKMMESAQEKLTKANVKEAESSGKLAELNEKIKKCDNLILSNQGLQKNLEIQNGEVKNKVDKLVKLVNDIGEVIEGL